MVNYLFGETAVLIEAGMDATDQRRYGHAVENPWIVMTGYSGDRLAVFVAGLGKETSPRITGSEGSGTRDAGNFFIFLRLWPCRVIRS